MASKSKAKGSPAETDSKTKRDSLAGDIKAEWKLIRAERKHVHTRTDGLGLDSVHGGIFGSFFKDAPAKNMLGRKVWPDVGVMEVTVEMETRNWGEQAGIFFYYDDDNYVKLVLEGMKDGKTGIVLAREEAGSPSVVKKIKLPGGRKYKVNRIMQSQREIWNRGISG